MRSRLADAAADRLANNGADEPEMTENEVLRVLAGIARKGKPGDRLRAAELLGKQMGLFSERNAQGGPVTLEMLVPKRMPRPANLEKMLAEKYDKK